MGACDCVISIEAKNEKILKERIESERNTMGFENGTDPYCGNWNAKDNGVRILNQSFTNYNTAFEHIMDTNDKWDCVDAVRVIEKVGTPAQNERIKKQKTKLSITKDNRVKFIHTWVRNVRDSKSKTKSCKKCNTRHNTDNINHITCSACGNSFLTDSQKTKVETLKNKVVLEENKLNNMIIKRGGKTNKYWLVGGWCPS